MYQVHVRGSEPHPLVRSQREATNLAKALARRGDTVTVHRIVRDGALFVASYAPKS
jgi:hypothetical protein